MEDTQTKEFSVKPLIEKSPFEDPVTQNFFTKWCEANDSIVPKYLSRLEWNERKKEGMFKKNSSSGYDLFVPTDLKLWEINRVISEIDKHKFFQGLEDKRTRDKKLDGLADMFQSAGVYIAKRLEYIPQGKHIAEETAKDLYRYGRALRTGDYKYQVNFKDMNMEPINSQQTAEIDTLFGVDKLDKFKHPEHASEDINVWEQTRQELLAQFFKTADKAARGEATYSRGIDKAVKRHLEKPIETPQTLLTDAIYRRGVHELLSELRIEEPNELIADLFKTFGIDTEEQKKSLRDELDIPKLKVELDAIRKTRSITEIGNKEREIAFRIQKAVSKLPYEKRADKPSYILKHHVINCVGASLIGGSLLNEVGIRYMVGGTQDHSLTLLITSDKKVYVQDFLQTPDKNIELTKDTFMVKSLDGKEIHELKKDDINPDDLKIFESALIMHPSSGFFANRVFLPGNIGHQLEVANNFAAYLYRDKIYEEAIMALHHSLALDPKNPSTYRLLGHVFLNTKDYEKAIESLKKAIKLDLENFEEYVKLGKAYYLHEQFEHADEVFNMIPSKSKARVRLGEFYFENGEVAKAENMIKEALSYHHDYVDGYATLGHIYLTEDKYSEAINVFKKAISLDPTEYSIYNNLSVACSELGDFNGAIKILEKAIELNPESTASYNNLSHNYLKVGEFEKALHTARQAIKLDETKASSYSKLGNALKSLGRYKEAIEAFKKVIELVDDDKDKVVLEAKKQLEELEK